LVIEWIAFFPKEAVYASNHQFCLKCVDLRIAVFMPVSHHTLTPSSLTMAQERILVVDDEDLIRETVSLALTEEGYQVTAVDSGQQAVEMIFPTGVDATAIKVDLVIIDLMLPGVNGLDICRMIRHHNIDLPILILSAKGTEMDRVVGLEVGADDYLPKPFGMRELIARCRALLRRHQWANTKHDHSVLTYQDIVLYLNEFRVTVAGQEVNLSPKEFRILELLMSKPNRVWSREELIHEVWGTDFMGDRKTVDVHIRWLREKIEADPGNPKYVTTLRGFGYRFG
jgi:two-component system phosphate regulon response regulator PhoB